MTRLQLTEDEVRMALMKAVVKKFQSTGAAVPVTENTIVEFKLIPSTWMIEVTVKEALT
jgi:hypothetical protein